MRPLLIALILCLSSLGHAETWRIGVIVSQTGVDAALGVPQAAAARSAAATLGDRGIYGEPWRLDLRDDGSDPELASRMADELLAAGALAIVCCTSRAATDRVAALLEARGVVMLALHPLARADGYAHFTVVSDDHTRLTAIAVDATVQGKASLALMTLDNAFGDGTIERFERALRDAQRDLAGLVRYPSDADVLTPEALWIATRGAGAVVVWGERRDLPVAIDALRRRGYLGLIYARPEAIPEALQARFAPSAAHRYDPEDLWVAVRSVLPPVLVAEQLPANHPHRAAVSGYRSRTQSPGAPTPSAATLVAMATIDDAIGWLLRAFEEVAALPLDLGLAGRRSATRDALITLPLWRGASGALDARDGDLYAARWQGLVPVWLPPSVP
jgi:branched-chain amino acid transport system substrate-binding protein